MLLCLSPLMMKITGLSRVETLSYPGKFLLQVTKKQYTNTANFSQLVSAQLNHLKPFGVIYYFSHISILFLGTSLDSEIAALLSEVEVVSELTKRCIEENSTTAQNQATYLERYNSLAERYEAAKTKLVKLQAAKAQREAKAEDIGGFMFELAEYGEPLTEFDDRLWLTVIDTVTVHRNGRLTFRFQTGHEITV